MGTTEQGLQNQSNANQSQLEEYARRLEENERILKDAINNSDVQYFTYFPEKHRAEISIFNQHYSRLPPCWDNYPDSFIKSTQMNSADARAFRAMTQKIESGADEASCVTRMLYSRGIYLWIRVKLTAIRDNNGKLIKVLGYATDVSDQKNAEDRIHKERLKIKILEGRTFESFTFNITQNSQADLQTNDTGLMQLPVSQEVIDQATMLSPPTDGPDNEAWQILLHVANRIPDPADREKYLNACGGNGIRRALKEGRFQSVIRYRRKIGNVVHWVSSSIEMIPDPSTGDLIAFFYTDDINDKVIIDRIMRRIIGTHYLSLSYLDLQTGKITVNSASDPVLRQQNGYLYAEAVQRLCDDIVLPTESESVRCRLLLDSIQKGLETSPVYTVFYTRKDREQGIPGNPYRSMKTDVFYLDEHRDIIVFLASEVTEIFEKERANREELEDALFASNAANTAKSEFLSRMSHDIRTPLNGIIGMTRLAAERPNPPETQDYLKKIGQSSRFLLGLVNDILDMTKAESGIIELHPEPYPIEDIMNYMDAVMVPLCNEKNIKLVIDARPVDYVPLVDIMRINQICFNLLSNAVKFTPEGGTVTCRFHAERIDTGRLAATIEISDTGVGMSEEFQRTLFSPFTQENRSDTADNRGSGLGLAIVKKLSDLMGGTISVKSQLGRGTTVTIKAEFECISVSEFQSRPENLQTGPEDCSQLAGKHVLLCEDHPLNQEIAKALLVEKGMLVEIAENGQNGLDMFKKSVPNHYSIVLMDIRMPVMDGYEATRAIRALPRPDAASVPVVAMTADAFAEDVQKCLANGMNAHIMKPIDPAIMFRTILQAVNGRSRQKRPLAADSR